MSFTDDLGTDQTLTLNLVGEVLSPDFASNASFASDSDLDVLNIDVGTVPFGESGGLIPFDISNLLSAGPTADLDLVSIVGSGDTSILTTTLSAFTDLDAGDHNGYYASFSTYASGEFDASYELTFTDELGTDQTLTLNLTGSVGTPGVSISPDLIYDSMTGEVWLDPRDTSTIMGYALKSDHEFLSANFTPILGGVSTSFSFDLSEANLSAITTPQSIGFVLPAGLTLAELNNLFTVRVASTALGAPVTQLDLEILCGVGDTNCDGAVDVSGDILPAFANFTGPGAFHLSRVHGDVEGYLLGDKDLGDADVDVADLLVMFGAFTGPQDESGGLHAPAEAGDTNVPDLIYNPNTGEVILDVAGAGIIGYVFKNGTNDFVFGNHAQILAGVKTSVLNELSEAAFASSVGANSIGNVFPTGMNLAALSAYLTINQVSTSLGAPVAPFDLVVLGPAVPEPSSYAMAALGLLALFGFGYVRSLRR